METAVIFSKGFFWFIAIFTVLQVVLLTYKQVGLFSFWIFIEYA